MAPKTLQQRIADWANSPDGQRELYELNERVRESFEEIRRNARVSHELMSKPIGPVWD